MSKHSYRAIKKARAKEKPEAKVLGSVKKVSPKTVTKKRSPKKSKS